VLGRPRAGMIDESGKARLNNALYSLLRQVEKEIYGYVGMDRVEAGDLPKGRILMMMMIMMIMIVINNHMKKKKKNR